MRRIAITYDLTTEESVEQGDFEETGWVDEDGIEIEDDDVVFSATDTILQYGPVVPSSSRFHKGVWYTQADAQFDEQRYSFHLKGFSEDEEQAVYNALVAK